MRALHKLSIRLAALFAGAPDWPVVRRPTDWLYTLRFYWQTWDKSNVALLAGFAVAIAALAAMTRFVYLDQARIDAARQRRADIECLAENVYYEARGEPLAGQHAVAEVTLNRVASPDFPDAICAVVHEKRWDAARRRYVSAFSWTELEALRRPRGAAWRRAMAVATAVYDGTEPRRVEGALFYHASYMEPSWARTKRRVATIGEHVFYR